MAFTVGELTRDPFLSFHCSFFSVVVVLFGQFIFEFSFFCLSFKVDILLESSPLFLCFAFARFVREEVVDVVDVFNVCLVRVVLFELMLGVFVVGFGVLFIFAVVMVDDEKF